MDSQDWLNLLSGLQTGFQGAVTNTSSLNKLATETSKSNADVAQNDANQLFGLYDALAKQHVADANKGAVGSNLYVVNNEGMLDPTFRSNYGANLQLPNTAENLRARAALLAGAGNFPDTEKVGASAETQQHLEDMRVLNDFYTTRNPMAADALQATLQRLGVPVHIIPTGTVDNKGRPIFNAANPADLSQQVPITEEWLQQVGQGIIAAAPKSPFDQFAAINKEWIANQGAQAKEKTAGAALTNAGAKVQTSNANTLKILANVNNYTQGKNSGLLKGDPTFEDARKTFATTWQRMSAIRPETTADEVLAVVARISPPSARVLQNGAGNPANDEIAKQYPHFGVVAQGAIDGAINSLARTLAGAGSPPANNLFNTPQQAPSIPLQSNVDSLYNSMLGTGQ